MTAGFQTRLDSFPGQFPSPPSTDLELLSYREVIQTSAWPFFMDATRGVLFRESLAWKLTSTTSTALKLQPAH